MRVIAVTKPQGYQYRSPDEDLARADWLVLRSSSNIYNLSLMSAIIEASGDENANLGTGRGRELAATRRVTILPS